MKKLQNLTLQVKAKELSVPELKNIKGGFSYCCCLGSGRTWLTNNPGDDDCGSLGWGCADHSWPEGCKV